MARLLILLAAAAASCFAQLDSYTVTVTAARSIFLPADQTIFQIQVDAPASTGLDAVLGAVHGAGIGIANFSGVTSHTTSGRIPQQMLTWTFTLNGPLADINATIAMLTQLQKLLSGGMTLSFELQGVQVSQQAQSSHACPVTDLMADARNQARQLATLAGFNLGPVQAVSDGSVGATAGAYYFVGVFAIGDALAATTPSSCTLVVKFGLI